MEEIKEAEFVEKKPEQNPELMKKLKEASVEADHPLKDVNTTTEATTEEKKISPIMEFLMVYGWACLVVLIAIGALWYFGALKMPTPLWLNTTKNISP